MKLGSRVRCGWNNYNGDMERENLPVTYTEVLEEMVKGGEQETKEGRRVSVKGNAVV